MRREDVAAAGALYHVNMARWSTGIAACAALSSACAPAQPRLAPAEVPVCEGAVAASSGACVDISFENRISTVLALLRVTVLVDGAVAESWRYSIDGRLDPSERLHVQRARFPEGKHTLQTLAVFQGRPYGLFSMYPSRFELRSTHTFTVAVHRPLVITIVAEDVGPVTVAMEERLKINYLTREGSD
jgi:hypothetical protein